MGMSADSPVQMRIARIRNHRLPYLSRAIFDRKTHFGGGSAVRKVVCLLNPGSLADDAVASGLMDPGQLRRRRNLV
jgi:hypothetical protein